MRRVKSSSLRIVWDHFCLKEGGLMNRQSETQQNGVITSGIKNQSLVGRQQRGRSA
jgi:hypothetical protein